MYTKIYDKLFENKILKKVPKEVRYTYLYFLACQHRTSAGIYKLPISYISHDLDLSEEDTKNHIILLCNSGLINYDAQNEIVFIPNFLIYNPIENTNQAKGVAKVLENIPETHLLKDFEVILSAITLSEDKRSPIETVLKALYNKFNTQKALSKPFRNPFETLSKQEEKKEEESIYHGQNEFDREIDQNIKTEEFANNEEVKKIEKKDNKEKDRLLKEEFEKIWTEYPKKEGKKIAEKAFLGYVKKKVYSADQYKKAIEHYKRKIELALTEYQYIQKGSTFFNSGFIDYIDCIPGERELLNFKNPGNGKSLTPAWAQQKEAEVNELYAYFESQKMEG